MTEQYPFSSALEKKAKAFLKKWNNPESHGVKCWYCDVSNIEYGSDILLIGLNPAGGDESKKLDENYGYLELPYKKKDYNSWIDEYWPGKGQKHQEAMKNVFKTMFGSKWESKLRASACTNIFPIRTKNVNYIDSKGWEFAKEWFEKIIKHIHPNIIICNGNSKNNSAWSYLVTTFNCIEIEKIPIGANFFVKKGLAQIDNSKFKVLGLPFLGRSSREKLFEAIKEIKPFN